MKKVLPMRQLRPETGEYLEFFKTLIKSYVFCVIICLLTIS